MLFSVQKFYPLGVILPRGGTFCSVYCKKGSTEMTIHEETAFEVLQADGLPGILVSNRPLRAITTDALHYLTQAQVPLYVRHGQLVRIQCREEGTPYIETLNEAALKGILARAMNFAKMMNGRPQHIPPPDNVCRDILALGTWSFPALDAVIEIPTLRPDGTLIDQPGYDAATHLVYIPAPHLEVRPIPFEPTREDIHAAIALIDEAIGEFPFSGGASYANAFAALLTIARAWYAAGRPHTSVLRVGSYQAWVDTIGGILAYAGIPHFLGNLATLHEQADDEAIQWSAFLHAWYDRYQDREVLVAVVVRDITSGSCMDLASALPDELADIHKGDLKRRLGKALAQRVGSRYDESGLRLLRASINRRSGAVYWKVTGMQVSQVSRPQKSEME